MMGQLSSIAGARTVATLSLQRAVLTDKEQEGRGPKAALNQGCKRSLNWSHILPLKLIPSDSGWSLSTWLCSVG